MKRIGLLILAAVLVVGVLLTLNGDASAGKRKGKKTPIAGGAGVVTQTVAQSRYYATVPNFTPAAGSYLIPNSDTVTTNFVLQGDNTGGATWVTIPVTEYELFAKSGYVVQRPLDLVSGTGVNWDAYETANGGGGYRLSAYTKSVSGTRTSYTNQSVTFAETDTGYLPIGLVGEINAEALKNAIVNILVTAGANVVIDDNGITLVAGNATVNQIRWRTGAFTFGDIYTYNVPAAAVQTYVEAFNDGASDVTQVIMRASDNTVTSAVVTNDDATPANSQMLVTVNDTEVLDVRETTSTLSTNLLLVGLLNSTSDRIRIQNTHTPSSLTDTGTAGDIAWDSNYVWVATAANTWRRIPLQQSANNIAGLLSGNLMVSTVALATTAYFGDGMTATTLTEANARTPLNFAGTARNFSLRTSSAQAGTGSLVFTVLKNGSATAVTFTIAAGAAAGVYSDLTHSFTFAAGDEISMSALNNGLGASAALQGWSVELSAQ